ncbi:MAG TPA: TolC family protein [Niabella sp.]|jgi:outer membrane protein|nr:TolC family protein [Chitinophagaceae bacterium]HRO86113.1 TolC family protein [Niabella sp.]
MNNRSLLLILCLFLFGIVNAQQKWTLQQCVEYAISNNISVKQADVQARVDKLTLEQSIMSQYPRVSSQHSTGYQFGRSIDPTSNQFTTNQILFANHSLDAGVDLFNWFSKRNTIEANKLLAQAGSSKFEKAKSDIALNVANAYLAALLNKEQIKVSEVQVNQSSEQVVNIAKQVAEGALPELNLAEMQTQMANDSATLISAKANYKLSLLQLQALLNLDAAAPFDIDSPPVDKIPIEPMADLEPTVVFASALENLPQQKINHLNFLAAQKNLEVAKASMYPTLSIFGGLNTRYANAQRMIARHFEQVNVPVGTVNINGIDYNVMTKMNQPTAFDKYTYFRQLSNNFSQNLGLGLSIPIFNGSAARTNWQKAKLNVEAQQLMKEQDIQTLKQDIYQAYTNVLASLEKFNAAKTATGLAQKTYDYSRKRFEVGLLNPIDLITNQNNLFRSKINMLSAQYDYVFKMKLLEFYKGLGLKL